MRGNFPFDRVRDAPVRTAFGVGEKEADILLRVLFRVATMASILMKT